MNSPKNQVVPTVILLFCVWTLINIVKDFSDMYSILSVLTGATGVALYYKGYKNYDRLFYIWVFMQLPNITYAGANIISAFPISLGLGISLGIRNGSTLEMYLNILPIGLYYLVKYFNVEKPVGHAVTLGRLRKGTFPQIQFPVSGSIEKVAGRSKLTAIYLIRLNTEVIIKDKTYHYLMLEPKNTTLILAPHKNQICGLRLCQNPELAFSDRQNPFVDWVTAETL